MNRGLLPYSHFRKNKGVWQEIPSDFTILWQQALSEFTFKTARARSAGPRARSRLVWSDFLYRYLKVHGGYSDRVATALSRCD